MAENVLDKEGDDMLESLQEKCDLFIQNRQVMQNGFTWDYPAVKGLSAMLCTAGGKTVDISRIVSCRKVLRDALVELGEVESQALISAATLLVLTGEPEKVFRKMMLLYQKIVDQGFQPSVYIMLTVLNIVKFKDESEFDTLVAQAADAYAAVKSNEWFSSVDISDTYKQLFAVSFAEEDIDTYIEKTRQCYDALDPILPSWESVVMVTDALLMNSFQAEEKCEYVIRLYKKMRDKGYEFEDDFEFSVLGGLALVCEATDKAVEDVIEVCDYLEKHPGMKNYRGKRNQFLTYAALLVEAQNIEAIEMQQYVSEFASEAFVMMNISMIMNMVENAPKKWKSDGVY